jgi:hypothetical protein
MARNDQQYFFITRRDLKISRDGTALASKAGFASRRIHQQSISIRLCISTGPTH